MARVLKVQCIFPRPKRDWLWKFDQDPCTTFYTNEQYTQTRRTVNISYSPPLSRKSFSVPYHGRSDVSVRYPHDSWHHVDFDSATTNHADTEELDYLVGHTASISRIDAARTHTLLFLFLSHAQTRWTDALPSGQSLNICQSRAQRTCWRRPSKCQTA